MAQETVDTTLTKTNNGAVNSSRPLCYRSKIWLAFSMLLTMCLLLLSILTFFWKKNNALYTQNNNKLRIIQEQVLQNKIALAQTKDFFQQIFLAKTPHLAQLNDIKNLIQLADYNLVYMRDRNNATFLLKLACKKLTAIANSSFSLKNIQELLSQNISQINALPQIDSKNILLELDKLQFQITKLSLSIKGKVNKISGDAVPEITQEKNLNRLLKFVRHFFQKLIIVRHLDESTKLVPQEILQQKLQLLLQQAKWAVLRNEETIYQSSLQQTKKAVQENFFEPLIITQNIIKQINNLEKIKLQGILPNLTPTINAIDILLTTGINSSTTNKTKEIS